MRSQYPADPSTDNLAGAEEDWEREMPIMNHRRLDSASQTRTDNTAYLSHFTFLYYGAYSRRVSSKFKIVVFVFDKLWHYVAVLEWKGIFSSCAKILLVLYVRSKEINFPHPLIPTPSLKKKENNPKMKRHTRESAVSHTCIHAATRRRCTMRVLWQHMRGRA